MRAFHAIGASFVPVELPEERPGPGEVLLALHGASLNYRDLALLNGSYAGRPARPYVPLSDGAGEVLATGDGVTRVRPGQRVVVQYVRDWIAGEPTEETAKARYGAPLDGMLRERMVVPAHALVPLPDGVSTLDAATLPVAGTTAWHALFEFGRLLPGQSVLVQGTGGVSMFALQLAKAAGARVLLTTRSPDKARGLGADVVIDGRGAWEREVLDVTSGGADLVVDVVGGESLGRSLRATRVGGRVAVVGFLDGMQSALDLAVAISRRIDLRGVSVGPRSALEALVRALDTLRIRPVVAQTFAFDDAPRALDALGKAPGKVRVRIAGPLL